MRPLHAIMLTLALLALIALAFLIFSPDPTGAPVDPARVRVPMELPGTVGPALLVRRGDAYVYVVTMADGGTRDLTPEEFAERLHEAGANGSWWSRLFNISSPIGVAWVSVGLLGQLLFTGRMLVQWFASERAKRSVVPTAFWWMSLIGATMLLLYFAWRQDVVGVLGQATGWIVYIRNLWLIRRGKVKDGAPAAAPTPAGAPLYQQHETASR